MTALIIIILLLLAVGALGAVIKGLLWLTVLALALAAASVAYGYFTWRTRSTS